MQAPGGDRRDVDIVERSGGELVIILYFIKL